MKGSKKRTVRLREAGWTQPEMFEDVMGLLRAGRLEDYRSRVLVLLRGRGSRGNTVRLCSLIMCEIADSLAEQVVGNPWDDRMKIRSARCVAPPEGYSEDTRRLAAFYASRDRAEGETLWAEVSDDGDRLAALLVSVTTWYCEVRGFDWMSGRAWKE